MSAFPVWDVWIGTPFTVAINSAEFLEKVLGCGHLGGWSRIEPHPSGWKARNWTLLGELMASGLSPVSRG